MSDFMYPGPQLVRDADTFQEARGLLCADRTPKMLLEQISAATRNVPLGE